MQSIIRFKLAETERVDVEEIISEINNMDTTKMDRLGILTSLVKLTQIINKISGVWLLFYGLPNISSVSREVLEEFLNFQKDISIGIIKNGLKFQKTLLEKQPQKDSVGVGVV